LVMKSGRGTQQTRGRYGQLSYDSHSAARSWSLTPIFVSGILLAFGVLPARGNAVEITGVLAFARIFPLWTLQAVAIRHSFSSKRCCGQNGKRCQNGNEHRAHEHSLGLIQTPKDD
jgi:hypothetical protein